MVQPEYTPWITSMEIIIDTTMLALPQGMEHTQNKSRVGRNPKRKLKYPDYTHIYTDGSKIEERVGCAVVR
jgi:hypothetical protein